MGTKSTKTNVAKYINKKEITALTNKAHLNLSKLRFPNRKSPKEKQKSKLKSSESQAFGTAQLTAIGAAIARGDPSPIWHFTGPEITRRVSIEVIDLLRSPKAAAKNFIDACLIHTDFHFLRKKWLGPDGLRIIQSISET